MDFITRREKKEIKKREVLSLDSRLWTIGSSPRGWTLLDGVRIPMQNMLDRVNSGYWASGYPNKKTHEEGRWGYCHGRIDEMYRPPNH